MVEGMACGRLGKGRGEEEGETVDYVWDVNNNNNDNKSFQK